MKLFVVSTPIGNLKDITLRALDVLKSVDIIAAEDTRVTKKLLNHYNISKHIISYREHVHDSSTRKIVEFLKQGKDVALVTDAGTPGISDPGARLVSALLDIGCSIVAVPGASAVTSALSVAGFNADQFTFMGYPPHKKGRKAFFDKVASNKVWPVVLYESPHRLLKTVSGLCDAGLSGFSIVTVKEISKVYETIYRFKLKDFKNFLENEKKIRGEFVLVINKTS